MAVLLSREPARREVVCDTSSLLVNAWRSMAWDPLAMAYWADWPTFHDDLIARRRWLGKWVSENAARVQEDADYCDPKAGAWWMWAMSHSIRGNADMGLSSRPSLQAHPGAGYGVQAQRVDTGRPNLAQPCGQSLQSHRRERGKSKESIYTRPYMSPKDVGGRGLTSQRADGRIPMMGTKLQAARGVAAQRVVPRMAGQSTGAGSLAAQRVDMRRPNLQDTSASYAKGVAAQRVDGRRPALGSPFSNGQCVQAHRVGDAGGLPAPVRWLPWFEALAERLKQVVVLNRGWQSACTPAALAARAGNEVAVLLDPPYVTSGRAKIYEQDTDPEQVNATARESYEWALKHGEAYRVAYCHTAGSFDFPDGWEIITRKYSGTNQDSRTQDAVAFSPRCLRPGRDRGQQALF